ncbi:hypothetical protein ACS0TY_012544 [Phlomoides rotata]
MMPPPQPPQRRPSHSPSHSAASASPPSRPLLPAHLCRLPSLRSAAQATAPPPQPPPPHPLGRSCRFQTFRLGQSHMM